ncbi:MAG: bactofilin family protein [Longimicrobiales bacterium]
MFGKDADNLEEVKQPRRREVMAGQVREERRVAAWIGASIVIKGNLTSSEDMTIAGEVEGDVTVREHTLVIAPEATIRGSIVARTVAVHGRVMGTITTDFKLEVGATGSVEGEITTPRLVLAEGAVLEGRVDVAMPSAVAS